MTKEVLSVAISWIRKQGNICVFFGRYWAVGMVMSTACTPETESSGAATSVQGVAYATGASIVLFNQTSADSIIGGPSDSKPGYVRSGPWSNDGPYPPKFFDIQVTERVTYDSLRIEMNGLAEEQNQELLSQNMLLIRRKQENSSTFLVKDVAFANFFDAYPQVAQLNFHFTVYRAGNAYQFIKSFQSG